MSHCYNIQWRVPRWKRRIALLPQSFPILESMYFVTWLSSSSLVSAWASVCGLHGTGPQPQTLCFCPDNPQTPQHERKVEQSQHLPWQPDAQHPGSVLVNMAGVLATAPDPPCFSGRQTFTASQPQGSPLPLTASWDLSEPDSWLLGSCGNPNLQHPGPASITNEDSGRWPDGLRSSRRAGSLGSEVPGQVALMDWH